MSLDITLNRPFIALIPVSGSVNPNPLVPQSENLRFCQVYQINFDTQAYAVGEQVLIDISKAQVVTQLTQSYFIADENDILFTEDPLM